MIPEFYDIDQYIGGSKQEFVEIKQIQISGSNQSAIKQICRIYSRLEMLTQGISSGNWNVFINTPNAVCVRGAVRCGAVRCGAVRCGAVRCGAVRCGAVRCGAVRVCD